MNSTRWNEFHQGLACAWAACPKWGAVRGSAASKAKWGECGLSQRLFPVLSPLCDGATCAGRASYPCQGTQCLSLAPLLWAAKGKGAMWHWDTTLSQCRGAAPWDSLHPCLGLGNSGVPQASRTASSDAGLEARVTAQANSQELAWSEERKGVRSIPKTWICLERFKKWGFSNNLVSQDTGVLYLH